MTVASEVSRITYNGDGVSQAFPVPFYFLVNSDLVVLLVSPAGVSVTQILAADYTVVGAGVLAGGTVNMTVPPPAGYALIIYRDPAATQLTDYQANDPFPAETHERALDKLTMLVQRLRSLASRSLTLSDSDSSNASTQLPKLVAGKLLGVSADGLSIVTTDPSAVGAGSIGTTELADNSVTTNKIVNLAVTFGKMVLNIFTGAAIVPIVANDYLVLSDVSDAGNTKRGLVSDIVALVPAPSYGKRVAQIQTFTTGAVATGTGVIPNDDTIPQITEGDQFLSVTITPQNAGSTLEFDITLCFGSSAIQNISAALFQTGTANALASIQTASSNANNLFVIGFKHVMPAGVITVLTFTVRLGGATSSTQTLNGTGGSRLQGGALASRITVKEYLP